MNIKPRQKLNSQLEDEISPDKWHNSKRINGEIPCGYCGEPINNHYMPSAIICPSLVVDCLNNWWKT